MSLPTGSRLGQYEILAVAGAGGMGIVYKARDTRLGRLVAIKLVPEHKLTDSDRKRRFIQEARAASALNHPNIVVIYDLAEDAGNSFLVMEYVDGQPLTQLISSRGMRLPDALRIASLLRMPLESCTAI